MSPTAFPLTLTQTPQPAEPYAVLDLLQKQPELSKQHNQLLHICTHQPDMEHKANSYRWLFPEATILQFPAWDCLPYDRMSPKHSIMAERLACLHQLCQQTKSAHLTIILTSANAITQRVLPKEILIESSLTLAEEHTIPRDTLINTLSALGFLRVSKAVEQGEFAVRGSIIDIIPSGYDQGVRLDFFGDDIESMRFFDPLTQTTSADNKSARKNSITLLPASEVLLSDSSIETFRNQYRQTFGAISKANPVYESICNQSSFAGMEHLLPLFYTRLNTLFDYATNPLIIISKEAQQSMHDRMESIQDYYTVRKDTTTPPTHEHMGSHAPLPPDALYITDAGMEHILSHLPCTYLSAFDHALAGSTTIETHYKRSLNLVSIRTQQPTLDPYQQLAELVAGNAASGKHTLLAAMSEGSAARIEQLLTQHNISYKRIADSKALPKLKKDTLGLTVLATEQGFTSPELHLIAEQDWLGERIYRSTRKKRTSEVFLNEANSFSEGEYLVHRDHGIGRFTGLQTLEAGGGKHDCLKLLYDGDDRLFVPVENMEVLSRYGSDEESVRLDKLGAA